VSARPDRPNYLDSIQFLHGVPRNRRPFEERPRAADLAVTAGVRQKMENPADRASEQHPSSEEI
jgi:hypothetical protein